jgi:hypothetical protein
MYYMKIYMPDASVQNITCTFFLGVCECVIGGRVGRYVLCGARVGYATVITHIVINCVLLTRTRLARVDLRCLILMCTGWCTEQCIVMR